MGESCDAGNILCLFSHKLREIESNSHVQQPCTGGEENHHFSVGVSPGLLLMTLEWIVSLVCGIYSVEPLY